MHKSQYKKLLLLGLITAVILLLPFGFAHAETTNPDLTSGLSFFTKTTIKTISGLIGFLLYLTGYFFHLLVYYGGAFLNWVLELNSHITENPAVQVGWPLVRDLVNLGFVFLIIIIAFSTILGQGSYQIKNTLPKLIIAAVLVNFSLLIATVFLDFAGVLTNFFISNAYFTSTGDGGVSQAIATRLDLIAGLKNPPLDSATSLETFSAATLSVLAQQIFTVIITIIGAITMFALAIMFLIRYVIIGFLLIMLPAAILIWVTGDKGWGDWSSKFFKYTFFGPIAGFFIYIALKSSEAFKASSLVISAKFMSDNTTTGGLMLKNIASEMGAMIMMVSILLYGLKQAEESCDVGGKTATKIAGGIVKAYGAAGLGAITGGKYGEWSKKLSKAGLTEEDVPKPGLRWRLFNATIGRAARRVGEAGGEFRRNYGGLTSLPRSVFEEVAAGAGWDVRKSRIKEEKKIEEAEKKEQKKKTAKERQEKINRLQNSTQAMNTTLTDLNNDLTKAQQDLRTASIGFTADPNKQATIQARINEINQKIDKVKQDIKTNSEELDKQKNKQKEAEEEDTKEAFKKAAKAIYEEEQKKNSGGEPKKEEGEKKK